MRIAILPLLLAAVLVCGCSDDSPTSPEPTGTYTPAAEARILPPDAEDVVVGFDDQSGDVSLAAGSAYAQRIGVGSILVGRDAEWAPRGFLRRVTAVHDEGGILRVETAPAGLTEAFTDLRVSATVPLTAERLVQSPGTGDKALREDDDGWFWIPFSGVVHDADADSSTTDDQLRLSGTYRFIGQLEAEIEIVGGELVSFAFVFAADRDISLELAGAGAPDVAGHYTLATLELPTVAVGDVVHATPILELGAHLSGNPAGDLAPSFSFEEEIRHGLAYARDGAPTWSAIGEGQIWPETGPHGFTESCRFAGGTRASMTVLLYDAPGPVLADTTRVGLAAELFPDASGMTIDITGTAGGSLSIAMDEGVFSGLSWSGDHTIYSQTFPPHEYQPQERASIRVVPRPAALSPPWVLTGPFGYRHEGQGEETVHDRLEGRHVVTWGEVPGWTTPEPTTGYVYGDTVATVITAEYLEGQSRGTVSIETEPTGLAAPWTLTGPFDFETTGQGDQMLADLYPGEYRVFWHPIDGYREPLAQTAILRPGETLVFHGAYQEIAPTRILLDPEPDHLDASWTLDGPDGFSRSGHGDDEVTSETTGIYTVTWGDISGWAAPLPESRHVGVDTTTSVTFRGIYHENDAPGVVTVDTNPESIEAGWTLSGPDGWTESDTGDRIFLDMAPGPYSIDWLPVAGYVAPDATTRTLRPGGNIMFRGHYTTEDSLATRGP